MVYTSQPSQYASQQNSIRQSLDSRVAARPDPMDFSALLDPTLLQSARQIYRTYFEVHPEVAQKPLGVAIDRFTHRGKLIFGGKPVLLPQECFVPINQIE